MINKLLRLISYFIPLFLGFLGIIWLIWSRFIRERTIREIPDLLLTEYRFWILLYICVIYIYIIKSLLRPKESSIFSKLAAKLVEIIYKPLLILDKAIKCKLLGNIYYDFTLYITPYLHIKSKYKPFIITVFQIIPRAIMVIFLLVDTFYFHKLAIFYNVILLGLLPLIYRYVKYSINEISEHYIELLEEKYEKVRIYEENCRLHYGEEDDLEDIKKSTAEFHNRSTTIKEYIEIKSKNIMDWIRDKVTFLYEAEPYSKKHIQDDMLALRRKSFPKRKYLYSADYEEINKLFYDLIDETIHIKMFLDDLSAAHDYKSIRYTKALIFILYFICWAYILIISYKTNPIELIEFKNLVINFMINLIKYESPF